MMSEDPRLPDADEQGRIQDQRLRDANEQLTLVALRAQERAEEEARLHRNESRLNAALIKQGQQLRSLASELILAEQRERKRLADELHDYLAQMIVLGRLKIGQARQSISAADSTLGKLIGDIDEIFTRSLRYTRTLMAELSPPVLQELGLPSAIQWLGEHMIKYGLTVDVRMGPQKMALPEDQAMLLYQSVRELLLNVVKHAGTDHATVTVSVEADQNLMVAVQDDGQGSGEPLLEKKMTGEHFGLFSIQERMEAMGGTMEAESAVGQGTRVTLRLPLGVTTWSEPEPGGALRQAAPARPPDKASGVHRLLLVDDHAMVRQGLHAILEAYADLVVIGEAANGLEAVAMAANAVPDVILMDVNMPQMDGIQATRRIKAAQPGIIVIGLSVNDSIQVMEAMTSAGAGAFVSKDAAAEQLHDVIVALSSGTPPSLHRDGPGATPLA